MVRLYARDDWTHLFLCVYPQSGGGWTLGGGGWTLGGGEWTLEGRRVNIRRGRVGRRVDIRRGRVDIGGEEGEH